MVIICFLDFSCCSSFSATPPLPPPSHSVLLQHCCDCSCSGPPVHQLITPTPTSLEPIVFFMTIHANSKPIKRSTKSKQKKQKQKKQLVRWRRCRLLKSLLLCWRVREQLPEMLSQLNPGSSPAPLWHQRGYLIGPLWLRWAGNLFFPLLTFSLFSHQFDLIDQSDWFPVRWETSLTEKKPNVTFPLSPLGHCRGF